MSTKFLAYSSISYRLVANVAWITLRPIFCVAVELRCGTQSSTNVIDSEDEMIRKMVGSLWMDGWIMATSYT